MPTLKVKRNTEKHDTFLGARFRFHAVAALLKRQHELHEARPIRVKLAFDNVKPETPYCPFCRDSELHVFRRVQDDEWAYCPECGFATDPVGLIALELRCSSQEAVDYLVFQHNLHRVSKTEIDEYLHHRSNYERFANLIQERLHADYSLRQQRPEHGLNPMSLHRLLDKLDLCQSLGGGPDIDVHLDRPDQYRYIGCDFDSSDTDPRQPDAFPYWENRPGMAQGLFGIVDHMVVESWFFPNLYDVLSGRIHPNTSPMRLFHGPGWGLVLVVPLQDVPGHFCGILCIGRNGDYPNDYVVRLFSDYGRRNDDTGFILPLRAFRAICRSEETGGELIAYNNPLHLIRTHLHYRDMPDLPLIGWIDDVENAAHYRTVNWSPFRSVQNKTLWMQSHQTWTVRTAIEQDAKIMLYDPFKPYPKDRELGNKDCPKFRPTWTALERMPSDAVPWSQYLDRYLRSKPPELAVEELKQITLTPQRFETCVAQLPSSNPVRQLAQSTPKPCRVTIGQYEVFEEAAGIFRKTPRQESPVFMTDARCFLDHVYFTARHVRKIYRVRVLYGGRTISFDVPVSVFEKDAIGTVTAIVRRAGMPEPTFRCKNRFYKSVVHAMSPLKPVETIASTGWNGKTRRLEFPQFSLSPTMGIIAKPERAKLLDDDFPAKYLEPPSLDTGLPDMPTEERPTLSQWLAYLTPFLSACTLPIIFPMLGKESRPVFLSGCSIEFLKPSAECLEIPVMPLENDADLKKLVKYSKQHHWPVLTTYGSNVDVAEIVRLSSSHIGNAIICLDDTDLLSRSARCNSHLVHLTLGGKLNIIEPNWQIFSPLLKSLFFSRLKEHLERQPKHESASTFLKAECSYWSGQILSFLGDA